MTQTNDARCLVGSMKDYVEIPNLKIENRADAFWTWAGRRAQNGLFPFAKTLLSKPDSVASIRMPNGDIGNGINFSSQEYLSLASHPEVVKAAVDAIDTYGVHSAGSTALAGNTVDGDKLADEIAAFLHLPYVTLFPTGWAAGFGVIKGLVRLADHVVMDKLSHNCLLEGAIAATRNVHLFKHLDADNAEAILQQIREKDQTNSILLVTEGTFSMDADSPDIAKFVELATKYSATFVLDVAHDLGCTGPNGTGQLGIQGMLGKVDIVMGSFSKSFASNGGFVAVRSQAMREYLRAYATPNTFSNALSPIQVAIVRKCLEIVRSSEGDVRRKKLMDAIVCLRTALTEAGFKVLGNPSPIVAVMMGREDVARIATREMFERGLMTNLIEFPAVASGTARLRMQVMTNHEPSQCKQAVEIIKLSVAAANTALSVGATA